MIVSYFLVFIIALTLAFFVCTEIFAAHPTSLFLQRVLRLYKISDRWENVDYFSLNEVEAHLRYLILSRCADENNVITELRNGYSIKYYPEDSCLNKRKWDFAYMEISNPMIPSVTLRLGFDGNDKLRTEIDVPLDDTNKLAELYFTSNQGSILSLSSALSSAESRDEIRNKWRSFVMRRIL